MRPAVGIGQTQPRARVLVAQFAAPLRAFAANEAGSAALLLAATVVALVWANSPWSTSYVSFWHTEFALRLGSSELALDLQHWVNDGLMVVFFLVVGLEVKRELVMGELTDRRRAAVPVVAAVAGLAVPAGIFLALNPSGAAAQAWGVVISTDTAFLLGALALVGPACPTQLRLFLLTLAVADDIGALTVIAVFYTDRLAWVPLLLAVAGLGLMLVLRYALAVWRGPAYLVIALGVWVAMHESGVHPTIAGVVIALFTPAFPPRGEEVADAARLTRAFRQSPNPQFARAARLSIERSVSANERLQILFQPWSSFVIVPIFALANAGVALDAATLRTAATSPVTLGVVAGLVVGKLVGILAGVGIAVRLRLGALAPGLSRWQLAGGAALSGVGFTIALFIIDLALDDPALADQARVGVLAGSLCAAVLGWAVFRVGDRLRRDDGPRRPTRLDPPVDPARDHIRGPVDAPLTLVEYGDFECPFCGRATGVIEDLRARFGNRLRYVFRHTPLSDVHPHAMLAAEAAEAAAAQGRFWEMHDRLFAHQDQLAAADLLDHAATIGLDVTRFSRDLGDARYARQVRDDVSSAEASGVTSTPTFFIDGRRHAGPYDADTLAARLLETADELADVDDGDAQPSGSATVPALGSRRRVDGRHEPSGDPVAAVELRSELVESPDDGAYPRLSSGQIALLQRQGIRRSVAAGDVLFAEGDPGYDFYVVLAGQVAIVENLGQAGQRIVSVSGPARFLGELNLLAAPQPVFLTAVTTQQGEVLDVDATGLRSAFAESPQLADLVTRAFLLRRSRLLALAADPVATPVAGTPAGSVESDGSATLRIVGRTADPDTRRLREWATAHQVASTVVDLDADPGACELLAELGLGVDAAPIAVWHEQTVQRASTDDLADLLHARPPDG